MRWRALMLKLELMTGITSVYDHSGTSLCSNVPTKIYIILKKKFFDSGSISNLMIWPRVLSSSEIHNIAHNCICPRDYSVTLTPDKVEMVGNVDYVFAGKCRVV